MKVLWNSLDQPEWEKLADLARAPMQQRWTYGAVHQRLGGQTHRAVVFDGDKPVAICQCLGRRMGGILNLSLASRGPLWLADCAQNRALNLLRRTSPTRWPRAQIFTLAHPLPSRRQIGLMTPATHAECTLPIGMHHLHGKWRNALKKADKYKISIRETGCNAPALRTILETDKQQQTARSYQALPAQFSQEWHACAPKDLRLFSARENGRIVASALFLRHGNTATYHIASTAARGREISAGRLVLWRAFQAFAAQGITKIDLGQIDTEKAGNLARFKLGAGAQPCRLGPSILAI